MHGPQRQSVPPPFATRVGSPCLWPSLPACTSRAMRPDRVYITNGNKKNNGVSVKAPKLVGKRWLTYGRCSLSDGFFFVFSLYYYFFLREERKKSRTCSLSSLRSPKFWRTPPGLSGLEPSPGTRVIVRALPRASPICLRLYKGITAIRDECARMRVLV